MIVRMFPHRWSLAAAAALALLTAAPAPVLASEGGEPLLHADFTFNGPFGTYDRAALQRGLQIYKEVCSNCHGLYEQSYRNIKALGYDDDQVKTFAGDYQVPDITDDGQPTTRPARASDRFVRPFPNEKAARAANGGALPPDLGLITKSRAGGPSYVFSLLQGYRAAPPDVKVPDGLYYNRFFPGHQIAMPPPLTPNQVTYTDGTQSDLRQEAQDIATFLAWAAEPEMEQRKQMGWKVIIFLVVAAVLLYGAKRKIWEKLH